VAGAGAGAAGAAGAFVGFCSGELNEQPHAGCSHVPQPVDWQQCLPHVGWLHVVVQQAFAQHGVSQQHFRLPRAEAVSTTNSDTVSNTAKDIRIRRIVLPPVKTG
jgi:hypothetical protein